MIVIFWLFILFFLETVFLETAGNRFRFKREGEGGRGVLMHSLLGVLVQAPLRLQMSFQTSRKKHLP